MVIIALSQPGEKDHEQLSPTPLHDILLHTHSPLPFLIKWEMSKMIFC